MSENKKIAVAMSGGVDSAVCAYLAKQIGQEVFGATMKLSRPFCDSQDADMQKDIEDAKKVCISLGIEHRVYELSEKFERDVIAPFTQAYISGCTPNPCIECNRRLKFGALLDAASLDGADKIATGHYARIEKDGSGRYLLRRALDEKKDQSYVLWTLTQKMLSSSLLPLGDFTKDEARDIALSLGLEIAQKGDSQDICFIPDGDYASFIEKYSGKKFECGDYIDTNGNILGKHKGVIHYTIGQRKGLGISLGKHIFVKDKDAEKNTVTLCDEQELFSSRVRIRDVNLIPFDSLSSPIKIKAKLRYRQTPADAIAHPDGDGGILLEFDTPQRAPARGQSAVLYDGDYVVGGGIITK